MEDKTLHNLPERITRSAAGLARDAISPTGSLPFANNELGQLTSTHKADISNVFTARWPGYPEVIESSTTLGTPSTKSKAKGAERSIRCQSNSRMARMQAWQQEYSTLQHLNPWLSEHGWAVKTKWLKHGETTSDSSDHCSGPQRWLENLWYNDPEHQRFVDPANSTQNYSRIDISSDISITEIDRCIRGESERYSRQKHKNTRPGKPVEMGYSLEDRIWFEKVISKLRQQPQESLDETEQSQESLDETDMQALTKRSQDQGQDSRLVTAIQPSQRRAQNRLVLFRHHLASPTKISTSSQVVVPTAFQASPTFSQANTSSTLNVRPRTSFRHCYPDTSSVPQLHKQGIAQPEPQIEDLPRTTTHPHGTTQPIPVQTKRQGTALQIPQSDDIEDEDTALDFHCPYIACHKALASGVPYIRSSHTGRVERLWCAHDGCCRTFTQRKAWVDHCAEAHHDLLGAVSASVGTGEMRQGCEDLERKWTDHVTEAERGRKADEADIDDPVEVV